MTGQGRGVLWVKGEREGRGVVNGEEGRTGRREQGKKSGEVKCL